MRRWNGCPNEVAIWRNPSHEWWLHFGLATNEDNLQRLTIRPRGQIARINEHHRRGSWIGHDWAIHVEVQQVDSSARSGQKRRIDGNEAKSNIIEASWKGYDIYGEGENLWAQICWLSVDYPLKLTQEYSWINKRWQTCRDIDTKEKHLSPITIEQEITKN